jgi:hypothetical protein
MKKILAHVSYSNKNYISFIKYLVQNNNQTMQTLAASLHGNIFDAVEDTKSDYVLLSIEEYTQEFHDFINDINKPVFIFTDKNIPENIIDNLKSRNNVRFIANKNTTSLPEDKTLFYDGLYDSEIFYDKKISRNNQIVVLLSRNNENNLSIKEYLYPLSNERIVCFNNPEFDHPLNLGVLSDIDTNDILNKSAGVIDVDNNYSLEAKACGCPYISCDGSIIQNIKNMTTQESTADLNLSSFQYFITQTLTPYILGV